MLISAVIQGAEMKGFSRRCQPRDFRCIHLSSQYIREESGGRAEEVIWLSHPRAGCQTWQRSVPNDYNMLNLLSFSPSCRFFLKRGWPTFLLHALDWRKSSLSLSEGSTEITTPFLSHTACCKRRARNPASRAFLQLTKTTRTKSFIQWGLRTKSTEEQTVNLVPWNRRQCQTECAR